MSKTFTEADWLKELERLSKVTPTKSGFSTASEIASVLGKTRAATRELLRKVMAEGRLEVKTEQRLAVDGIMRHCPCYRIRTKAE